MEGWIRWRFIGIFAPLIAAACTDSGERTDTGLLLVDTSMIAFQDDSATSVIVDLAVDGVGGVWTLSATSPFIRYYDPAGKLLDTLGRAGMGPGELNNPWSIMAVNDPARPVRVWDTGTRRIVALGTGSVEPSSVPAVSSGMIRGDIRSVSFGRPNMMRRLGRGYALQVHSGQTTQTSDHWRSILVYLDSAGVIRDTISDFRTLGGDDQPIHVALAPIPLWTVCGDSTVVVVDPETSRIRWFTPSGDPIRLVPIDSTRRDVTDDDLRPYLRHVIQGEARANNSALAPGEADVAIQRVLDQARQRFATVAPPAVDVLCDDHGRVWLEDFSTADHPLGYGRTWRVYGTGRSETVVTFPGGFAPQHVTGDRAIGVMTDSLDVQRVATVRFRLP